jgi:hypothetical protein
MAYVYRTHDIEGDWEQVLADATVARILQVRHRPGREDAVVEVMVADSLPDAADEGVDLVPGDAMVYDQLQYLGTSGTLYARAVSYTAGGTVQPIKIRSVSTS